MISELLTFLCALVIWFIFSRCVNVHDLIESIVSVYNRPSIRWGDELIATVLEHGWSNLLKQRCAGVRKNSNDWRKPVIGTEYMRI